MGPKVRAALAFADSGGRAVITSLERLREGVEGAAGTTGAGMTERVLVRRGAYYDSVTLMLVSRAAATATGDEVVRSAWRRRSTSSCSPTRASRVEDDLARTTS